MFFFEDIGNVQIAILFRLHWFSALILFANKDLFDN